MAVSESDCRSVALEFFDLTISTTEVIFYVVPYIPVLVSRCCVLDGFRHEVRLEVLRQVYLNS